MPRFSLANLRVRLLLLVLLAIVPALVLMLHRNIELRRLVVADVKDEALRLARLAASDQQDSIRDSRQLLFALAQLSEVRSGNPEACSALFSQLLRQYPQYTLLGVISPEGDIFCSAYPTKGPNNVANAAYFQRVLQTHDFAISDYETNDISKKATLNFGYPVLDENNQVQAVVIASLDLTWLNRLAAEAQLPERATFTVFDRNGTILVRYPNPEIWVGQPVPESALVELIQEQPGEGTVEADSADGTPHLFAYSPLYGAPGSGEVLMSIGIPTAVAFADANEVLVRNLVTLGLVTLLSLAAAWFGGDLFVLRWVRRLVEATRRLSAGDLTVRSGLPYGQGELSQLARAFDEMADSLQRRIYERDLAQNALQDSQRTLLTLLTNLPGMAYRGRNDQTRTMEFVSEGCLDLTGYYPAELIENYKLSYIDLVHPDDRASLLKKVQSALEEAKPFQMIYRITAAGGEEKWVLEKGRGVVSEEGALVGVEGFITDTTERVLAYQMLEQRVADRTRELSALYDVTAVASKSLDLTATLEKSLEQVLTVMGYKAGSIHLLSEAKDELRLAIWRGLPSNIATEMDSLLPGDGLPGWVIEHEEPLVVPKVAVDERVSPAMVADGFQAYIGAPMRARGRALGVLSVIGDEGQEFKMEEVALLASIADQIGVAVENAQLYAAERQRRRQADTLLQVASVVGSTLYLDEVLARILDQLRRVVAYDSASVQLLEEGNLQVIAARGFADIRRVLGITFSLHDTPNHKVVAEGCPVNLADAPALYPSFRRSPFSHIRSWLGVPLHVQEQIIGIITVDRHQPGGYDQEEVRLTTAFADLAALALENARLYQQAEQLAVMEERSRLARELHDSVTQSLYSLTLFAEVGRRSAEASNLDQVTDYVSRLGQVAQQALKEMRLLVYELRTAALETEGLIGAIQQRLDAVEKRAGVEARLLVESMVDLPPIVEEGLYRIAQEALNNALKHAEATSVTVSIRIENEHVELEVFDTGLGFDPDRAGHAGGLGLTSMRERSEQLGGMLTIWSKPGAGTRIRANVPIRRSWSRPVLPVDKFSEVSQ